MATDKRQRDEEDAMITCEVCGSNNAATVTLDGDDGGVEQHQYCGDCLITHVSVDATLLPKGTLPHFVNPTSEHCMCGAPATHKVGEEIPHNEPSPWGRHNFTAYVCCTHFRELFGPAVFCPNDE